jgi:lysophospholipase L1-like esterase
MRRFPGPARSIAAALSLLAACSSSTPGGPQPPDGGQTPILDASVVDAAVADQGPGSPDLAPQGIGPRCFPTIYDPNVPGPNYDQFKPTVGSHCFGTNHQAIQNIERVVFLGDSVTVGVPNLGLNLVGLGFPSGAGTPDKDFYRSKLADALATKFGLSKPSALWKAVNPQAGTSLLQSDGAFASCARWGGRNDDLLLPPQKQLEVCIPPNDRTKRTLIVFTSGGNDLANLTKEAIAGASRTKLDQLAAETVKNLEDAIVWIKTPGRFPNGVSVIYGNIYEFTDGTGDTSSCPAAQLAGFGSPPPDPAALTAVVSGIEEQYMRIAVQYGVDLIWMLEHFCGHGWKSDDASGRCYRGPNTPRYFDVSCTHPSTEGHQKIVDMFMAVVNE